MVNESVVKRFGLIPQAAVGKVLWSDLVRVTIVGVVADTKYGATRDAVEPIYYLNRPSETQLISVRVKPGRTAEAVASIERIWHQFAPTEAIDLHFLDDSFDKLFASDQTEAAMFGLFVGIAIFIACLRSCGVHGRAANQRNRHSQDLWRTDARYRSPASVAVLCSRSDCQSRRMAVGLLLLASLAREFRLSDHDQSDLLRGSGRGGVVHCVGYRLYARVARSTCQSGLCAAL